MYSIVGLPEFVICSGLIFMPFFVILSYFNLFSASKKKKRENLKKLLNSYLNELGEIFNSYNKGEIIFLDKLTKQRESSFKIWEKYESENIQEYSILLSTVTNGIIQLEDSYNDLYNGAIDVDNYEQIKNSLIEGVVEQVK